MAASSTDGRVDRSTLRLVHGDGPARAVDAHPLGYTRRWIDRHRVPRGVFAPSFEVRRLPSLRNRVINPDCVALPCRGTVIVILVGGKEQLSSELFRFTVPLRDPANVRLPDVLAAPDVLASGPLSTPRLMKVSRTATVRLVVRSTGLESIVRLTDTHPIFRGRGTSRRLADLDAGASPRHLLATIISSTQRQHNQKPWRRSVAQ